MLPRVNQSLPLDEAIQALRRDPTQPVLVKVDEGLTVEVRAVEPPQARKRSAADLFREIGRWEGENWRRAGRLVFAPALEPPGT